MDIDEALELDYLIQKISPEPVTVNANSDEYELDGFETRTSVFKPNKTGTYEINLNNQTYRVKVVDIPDSVVDTFDYLSEGENLDGRNGWTDNSGHLRGITSFSQTFSFNAVGRAVSSGSPSNTANKGECFRSLPNEPYGRLK